MLERIRTRTTHPTTGHNRWTSIGGHVRAVDRWRILTLARALTEMTLSEYVRTRQPAVVANASGMFAAVTGGAYKELRQDESGEGLSVVTRRDQVLGPEQLSRGTAEQLYLCLRLGLAVASVLRDFAAGQQVIFFTCHPTTVGMLRTVVPGVSVHEMPRYGPRVTGTDPAAVHPAVAGGGR